MLLSQIYWVFGRDRDAPHLRLVMVFLIPHLVDRVIHILLAVSLACVLNSVISHVQSRGGVSALQGGTTISVLTFNQFAICSI